MVRILDYNGQDVDRTVTVADVVGLKAQGRQLAQVTAGTPEEAARFVVQQLFDAGHTAYYAGGCFWGVEHYLERLDGVAGVESGYMGGTVDEPTYEQVVSKTTGHLVEIVFIVALPEQSHTGSKPRRSRLQEDAKVFASLTSTQNRRYWI